MTIRTRIASVASIVAVAVAVGGLGAAAPASAFDLSPLNAIGSIDSIALTYDYSSPKPILHIVGWAGDLNLSGSNGDSAEPVGVELYEAGPGGAHTTIGWGERHRFDYPRPDVQLAYPSIGPNQGFDVYADSLTAGSHNICLRLYSFYTYPESASPLACQTVNIPKQNPTVATMTGSGDVGSPLTMSLPPGTAGVPSYSWAAAAPVGWIPGDAHDGPTTIPGQRTATFTPGPALIGRTIWGTITLRLPGVILEERPNPKAVLTPYRQTPERIASDDRYSTSVAASQKAFPDAVAGAPVAYIASGAAFPDALSAGAAAAKVHGTLLLTPPTVLDTRVAAELVRLHPARIVVVGGPAALSENVVAGLRALPISATVTRISGQDRFAVSRAVVADAFGASAPDVYLVTGNAFPDALAAAAAGASAGRPVLLTNGWLGSPDQETAAALRSWKTTHVTIVGGTAGVSTGIESGLARVGISVSRVAGADRFATAAALARTLPSTQLAYLANGLRFPDALTAAVLESSRPAPLLLTTGQCAPVETESAMVDTGVTRLVLVGGPAAEQENVADFAC
ncbi:cell wall-binding repeat-containing protein [Leifsonia sp. Le1]|uniref:cell wall-binding repeat-containing protein n=1 Tax=Leifsonia sp. Le1 TaxID=3404918 RepID=UPI003EB7F67F